MPMETIAMRSRIGAKRRFIVITSSLIRRSIRRDISPKSSLLKIFHPWDLQGKICEPCAY